MRPRLGSCLAGFDFLFGGLVLLGKDLHVMVMKSAKRLFLSLTDGTFRLGDRLIFENTSWTFHRHEQWAIVGANGSGKSLLADGLRGRLPLVGGELRYHFQPPEGLMAEAAIAHVSFERRKLDLGDVVGQSRWNSMEEEAALAVKVFLSYERVMDVNPFEVTNRHQRARLLFEKRQRRAIEMLDVQPFLNRQMISLSNGEAQRVQLAGALCGPMRLLILDEPFAGLDVNSRRYLHAVFDKLMATPLRVLLIVTRAEDLPARVTHLLCVDRCRVVAAGPRAKILSLKETKDLLARGPVSIVKEPVPAHAVDKAAVAKAELVRMSKVTVRYGETVILRDINWTIHAGESWALLGANGSGKTTLLSLIAGDHPQVYANDVTVFGKPRGNGESMWEIKRQIGWFSPELHLHFDSSATCFEVVASGFYDTIGLFEAPTSRQRTAARRLLAAYNLIDYSDCPLQGLSAGLQRMVLLLRALVKEPRLLILDEPCQGLDRANRELFIRAVDAVNRSGAVTVIYVTHRRDELPPSIKKTLRLGK